MSGRRLFVLTVNDPEVGLAVRPVGVLGVEGERFHVSFVPYSASVPWRDRIGRATVPLPKAVARWLETADGVGLDLLEADAPGEQADLEAAVEALVDELLAAGAGEGAAG